MSEREIMEYDVIIVGAGPAGLSCAIRLKQLKPELMVAVIEKGAEVGGAGAGCYRYETKDKKFKYTSQQATVETKWWDEWTSRYGKTLPAPLKPPEHWMHPKLSSRFAATMHEDSFATDVSKEPGPIPNDVKVEYFHVLEKGTKLSGMAPFRWLGPRLYRLVARVRKHLPALRSQLP